MSTERFYAKLPSLNHFIEATNVENFVSVPNDWLIVITDIAGSTQAIEAGRYKEVNLLGASSIAVVLNIAGATEIPYVFGGDGASIVIPPSLVERVKPALRSVQQVAETEFGMNLRVGCVPMSVVKQGNYDVKIAKLKISDNYHQAMFTGGGLNYATDLVKAPETAPLYAVMQDNETSLADFSGLECRWQSIPSQHGETVSLLVLATAHDALINHVTYRNVIEKIYEIYGTDENFHPVSHQNLKLTLNSQDLSSETKIRAGLKGTISQWLYLSQIQFENILGLLFMSFKLKVGGMNWGNYKSIVTTTSDYKKFDDMLRMIIAGTSQQRKQLTEYLEGCFKAGQLVYGLHTANSALMTCLVFERSGTQVHFIDGADGGYALAAKPLKEKLKHKARNWKSYTTIYKLRQQFGNKNVTS